MLSREMQFLVQTGPFQQGCVLVDFLSVTEMSDARHRVDQLYSGAPAGVFCVVAGCAANRFRNIRQDDPAWSETAFADLWSTFFAFQFELEATVAFAMVTRGWSQPATSSDERA